MAPKRHQSCGSSACCGTLGAQLSLTSLAPTESQRPAGPNRRTLARNQASRVVDGTVQADTAERAEAIAQVKRNLVDWITYRFSIGGEFQSCDFNEWMHEQGMFPRREVYDPRAVGAMFRRLVRRGRIATVGYRSNSGSRISNYNSTTRPVYRLVDYPEMEDFE